MKRRLAWLGRLVAASLLLALASGVLSPSVASALDVPPKPADIPIVDQTGTLSDQHKQTLAKKIADERSATGNQIAVLMVSSLEGQALEDYSLAVARGWGIGQQERDSGVLLLVAKDDRRLRIEVGYGLEGALPDIRAGRIIEDRIKPQFRQNKYYEGIDQGIDGIIAAIRGEADPNLKPEGSDATERQGGIPFELIFWGIFIIPIWLSSILARTKSWWLGGVIGAGVGVAIGVFAGFLFAGLAAIGVLALLGLLFDRAVSSNYRKHAGNHQAPSWWAGGPWIGGGGSSSGGGFGSFGGGSFGGGGASGDW